LNTFLRFSIKKINPSFHLRHTGEETVSQFNFCHSGQAKRDPESRNINEFWMPACAGMTTFLETPLLRNSREGRCQGNHLKKMKSLSPIFIKNELKFKKLRVYLASFPCF
jgi:hypothetical protein